MIKNLTKTICLILTLCLLSGCSLVITKKIIPPKEDVLEKETGTVTICIEALDEKLYEEEMPITENTTAFDAIVQFTKAKGIELVHDKGYVQKIGEYTERDHGASSGWLYYLNGESAMTSAKDQKLSVGDVILWKYVKDFAEG